LLFEHNAIAYHTACEKGEQQTLNRVFKNLGIYIVIFGLVLAMAWFYRGAPEQEIKEVDYSNFATQLKNEKIEELTVNDRTMTGALKNGDKIVTYAPSILDINILNEQYIYPQIKEGTLTLKSDKPKTTPWIVTLLPTIIMVVILVAFWFVFMNQGQGGGGKVMSFGKSRAKLHKEDDLRKITFADVAGLAEEKEFRQRVGGEAVGPVQPTFGAFAGGIEPGQVGAAGQIDHDPAAGVMLRRDHRDRPLGHVDPQAN